MEFDEEKYKKDQEDRRYYFAKFCWQHKKELTTEGRVTWEERFNQMEGVSLRDYIKEYKSTHNQKERR